MVKKTYLHDITELRVRSRGYLPHWEVPGATYAVTIRLADSLPRAIVDRLRDEHRALARVLTRAELRERVETDLERELHYGAGIACMNDPRVADIVASAFTHFDGLRYRLVAWCVMPNHAHIVFTPMAADITSIVHSWKSYTSNAVNALLGREGRLWQPEYFDRIIRDERHLTDAVSYVLDNPIKAGLRDWKWTSETWTAG
ncbi:MAG TPA: transposase [Thermoanaerobaculia bacterium]